MHKTAVQANETETTTSDDHKTISSNVYAKAETSKNTMTPQETQQINKKQARVL
jgi:hypothetical protein